MSTFSSPEPKFSLLRLHGEAVNQRPTVEFRTYRVDDAAWNQRLADERSHLPFQRYITELLGVTNVTALQRGTSGRWYFQTMKVFQ